MLWEFNRSNSYPQDGKTATSDDELRFILQLLDDYTVKLEKRKEITYRLKERFVFFAITFTIVVPLSCASIWISYPRISSFMLGLMIFFCTLVVGFFILLSFIYMRRLREEKYITNRLRTAIERLVNRASQLEDHGRVDFTDKIALDLRLAELEALIREV